LLRCLLGAKQPLLIANVTLFEWGKIRFELLIANGLETHRTDGFEGAIRINAVEKLLRLFCRRGHNHRALWGRNREGIVMHSERWSE
jgi:hypothetical protein